MRRALTVSALLFALGLFVPTSSFAQAAKPAPLVEFHTGYAGFVDESWIKRAIVGGAARVYLSPRVAVGPEFLYLHAAGPEHDWTLTGNVALDLRRETDTSRITPFLIVGAGLLSQTTQVGTGPFTAKQGTLSGGGGVRIALGRRFFVAPEARLGIEPEIRMGVTVGFRGKGR